MLEPSFYQSQEFLDELCRVAQAAGDAILAVYHGNDWQVTNKLDNSPLTAADLAAHTLIADELQLLFPGIPVLSEEAAAASWLERQHWQTLFIVDPLDGTKEFLKRNGEFTVNIALVRNGKPVLGIVHAPVLSRTWYANDCGAWRQDATGTHAVAATTVAPSPLRIVASRSHANALVEEFLKNCPAHELVSKGSSLKLCLVADGSADLYPRLAPTMEWDTAAAHAICTAAGAAVTDLSGNELRYNKPDLRNPHFMVAAPQNLDWQSALPGNASAP